MTQTRTRKRKLETTKQTNNNNITEIETIQSNTNAETNNNHNNDNNNNDDDDIVELNNTNDIESGDDDSGNDEVTDDNSSSSPDNVNDFDCPIRIFVGTYTGSLYGLESLETVRELISHDGNNIDDDKNNNNNSDDPSEPSFLTLFVTSAHRGSIRSLAVSSNNNYLISGGLDEVIQIYNLSTLKQIGSLHRHSASINQLVFPTSSTFLSSSNDGIIGIWNSGHKWEMIGKLKGHKGSIDEISIHPSNKILISSGSDSTIRMFDLIHGKLLTTYHRKLPVKSVIDGGSGRIIEQTLICWSDSGDHYVNIIDRLIHVYDNQGKLILDNNILLVSRALSVVFLSLNCLVIGCENGEIIIIDVEKSEIRMKLLKHKTRVRNIHRLRIKENQDIDTDNNDNEAVVMVSSSTDGQLYLWNLTSLCNDANYNPSQLLPIAHAKSESRITSIAISLQYQKRHFIPVKISSAKSAQSSQAKTSKTDSTVKNAAQSKTNSLSHSSEQSQSKSSQSSNKKNGEYFSKNKKSRPTKSDKPQQKSPANKNKNNKSHNDNKANTGVKIINHKKRAGK